MNKHLRILTFILITTLVSTQEFRFHDNIRLGNQDYLSPTTFSENPNIIDNFPRTLDLTQSSPDRVVEIFGNYTLGYYTIPIYLGTHHSRFDVIIDTGSATTTLTCSTCKECGSNHKNPQYQISPIPRTFNYLNCVDEYYHWHCNKCSNSKYCTFGIYYSEGSSYEGNFAKDYVLLRDEIKGFDSNTDFAKENYKSIFGCTTKETGMLKTQVAEGIFGLSPQIGSINYPPNLLQIEKWENRSPRNVFSICFATNGGYMRIGNQIYDKHYHNDKLQTVKYVTSMNRYAVY